MLLPSLILVLRVQLRDIDEAQGADCFVIGVGRAIQIYSVLLEIVLVNHVLASLALSEFFFLEALLEPVSLKQRELYDLLAMNAFVQEDAFFPIMQI